MVVGLEVIPGIGDNNGEMRGRDLLRGAPVDLMTPAGKTIEAAVMTREEVRDDGQGGRLVQQRYVRLVPEHHHGRTKVLCEQAHRVCSLTIPTMMAKRTYVIQRVSFPRLR